MIAVRLAELRSARLVGGDVAVTHLAADSRLARAGSLFACLRGARADGHSFVSDAARRGAVAVLCEPGRYDGELPRLESEDPLRTLGELARIVRDRSRATVVAVAGAAGKTTTKDVLRALLAPHLRVVASPASFNNELGVPLTLAQLEPDTDVCVCELGTGARGELAALCTIARPDVAILTALGPEHLEHLGSVEEAAAEEASVLAALPPGAPAVVPRKEPLLAPHRRTDLDEWTFGLDAAADVRPLRWDVRPHATEAAFAVRGRRVQVRTNLRLPHHRLALAAALAACAALGLPPDEAAAGAAHVELAPHRGEERPRRGGGLLIDDAYNANPLSVDAALEALAARRDGGRAVAVLGEMAELGPTSAAWHAAAGARAAELGIDLLVAVGPAARPYVDGACGRIDTAWLGDDDAAAALPGLLRPGDVVLLKASRTARLERLAPAVLDC